MLAASRAQCEGGAWDGQKLNQGTAMGHHFGLPGWLMLGAGARFAGKSPAQALKEEPPSCLKNLGPVAVRLQARLPEVSIQLAGPRGGEGPHALHPRLSWVSSPVSCLQRHRDAIVRMG